MTVFGRQELEPRAKRIKQIASGELVGKATADAIAAMQSVVLMSATLPAIMAASVHH